MRRASVETHSSGDSADQASIGGSSNARRRNPIAAQACETCRTRKTRCDEKRPRCGLCERLDLVCVFREPRPTKRDKTAETILATMRRIDGKLDRLLVQPSPSEDAVGQSPPQIGTWRLGGDPLEAAHAGPAAPGIHRLQQQQHMQRTSAGILDEEDLRGALSVFPWPSIQRLLVGADIGLARDLEGILSEGSGWLVRHEMLDGPGAMPCDVFLSGSKLHVVRGDKEQSRTAFSELTAELMAKYAHAYFGAHNLVYPILDREDFMEGIMPIVTKYGFGDGCLESLIALLVFALGKLACDGVSKSSSVVSSAIRGVSMSGPPALGIFNEARRRFGFVMGSSTVQNAQAMILMAIYYECCSKHLEHWRLTITAAEAMKAVLRIERNWDSHGIDMIRRVYWTCNVIESWYYLDLNLPRSDATGFQDFIPLPDFDDRRDFEGETSVESKYQYNFLSMVSLRRIIHRIFEELYEPGKGRKDGEKSDQTLIIAELLRQLDAWRSLLPHELRWNDSARTQYDIMGGTSFTSPPKSADHGPLHIDILLAQLRCRYYYARFMIFRPYAWKALHAPTVAPAGLTLSPVVVDGFVHAVDSMLEWPVAYPPVCDKKRLIPNTFAWTQSFVMFLLVLRAVKENDVLWQLCEDRLGKARIEESATVMLEWLKDLKSVDGVAVWAWRTLRPLYGLSE